MKNKDLISQILRAYSMFEYIDFISRSGAAKGTIEWSNYVADFLLKEMEHTKGQCDSPSCFCHHSYNKNI